MSTHHAECHDVQNLVEGTAESTMGHGTRVNGRAGPGAASAERGGRLLTFIGFDAAGCTGDPDRCQNQQRKAAVVPIRDNTRQILLHAKHASFDAISLPPRLSTRAVSRACDRSSRE
eukprot:scaffold25811_cov48-Phaeocystis_antarctica.AAC.2